MKAALKDEKILRALENYGVDAIGSTPEEFKATIAEDIKQWAAAIQAAVSTLRTQRPASHADPAALARSGC